MRTNLRIRSQTEGKNHHHGQAEKTFHSRNPRTLNTSRNICTDNAKNSKVCRAPARLRRAYRREPQTLQSSRKSAVHLNSTGSFCVLGRGRRQKIDQRSDEAKTFYVPTESRNCLYSCFDRCLNKGRGILETHFGSLLRLGPTWNLSVPPYNR